MAYYDDELRTLAMQTARKQQLDRELESLESQRAELDKKVLSLKVLKSSEQQDVDRLEGRSLTAFFYRLTGKMNGELSREKEEAYAAAVRYDSAVKELDAVKADIQRLRDAQRDLRDCEKRYSELLAAKTEAVRISGTSAAEKILFLEKEITRLDHQTIEIREAIIAGQRAQHIAVNVLSSLDSADGYATWDLLGGGLLVDMMKHSQLDDAQEMVEQLQIELRRFRTELADVSVQNKLNVRVDGFLGFADCFFDGLIADWAVKDKIKRSRSGIEDTIRQIEKALSTLHNLQNETTRSRDDIRHKIDLLVMNTSI